MKNCTKFGQPISAQKQLSKYYLILSGIKTISLKTL